VVTSSVLLAYPSFFCGSVVDFHFLVGHIYVTGNSCHGFLWIGDIRYQMSDITFDAGKYARGGILFLPGFHRALFLVIFR